MQLQIWDENFYDFLLAADTMEIPNTIGSIIDEHSFWGASMANLLFIATKRRPTVYGAVRIAIDCSDTVITVKQYWVLNGIRPN